MPKTIAEEASEIFAKNEELKKAVGTVDTEKKCTQCGNKIGYEVVTDHSSEGDGASVEVETGHSEDCSVMDN